MTITSIRQRFVHRRTGAPEGPAQRREGQADLLRRRVRAPAAGLRRIMAEKDLDAVVLTSYHSIKYYSDFLFTTSAAPTPWWSPRTTPSPSPPTSTPACRGAAATATTSSTRTGAATTTSSPSRKPCAPAASTRAGSASRTTRCRWTTATRSRPPSAAATLVDVAQAAMRQRMIKSAEEIEVIKHGARIGDLGGEAIRNAITAGHHRVRGRPDRHRSHGPRDRPDLPGLARSATPGSGSSPASTPTAPTTGPPPARSRNTTSCP